MNNNIKRGVWVVATLMGSLGLAVSAQGASFDCGKAQTKVEHLICDNPEISRLDDELAVRYKVALQDQAQAEAVKSAQKQWLKKRDACADAACVLRTYKMRLIALTISTDGEQKINAAQPMMSSTTDLSAGKYKMIRDTIDVPHPDGIYTQEKHAEVCTAFLKNLEASSPYPPMACDVTFKPEFTDFKTPEWKDIDVWENRDLELMLSQGSPKTEEEIARGLDNIKGYIKAGLVAYQTARFDIDNDGIPDQVLARIHGGMCDAKKYADEMPWRHYKVYDPASRKIDIQKSKFYDGYWGTTSLFSYKGVTYYASFGGSTNEPYFGKNDHAQKWYIRLYRPLPMEKGLRTAFKQPVALGCKYLYLPTKNQRGN